MLHNEYMRRFVNLIYNPLVSGSLIVFVGSHVANFFNLSFNLFMSRNLSAADYGSLVSLVSLLILVTLPAGSMVQTIVKFASAYFAQNDIGMVRGLFLRVFKICLLLAVVTVGMFIIGNDLIRDFFKIKDQSLIYILSLSMFFSFISVINTSLLQARLSFKFISFSNIIGSLTKVIAGAALVLGGFSVAGALFAIFFSSFITYIISFIPLRFLLNKANTFSELISLRTLFFYGAPASTALFALTALISTDILLVKHFFDPIAAGSYAAGLSLVGRVVFYISAPIGFVMFPLVVQKHTKKENYNSVFGLSLLLVTLASIPLIILYFVFPQTIITLLVKKSEYLSVAKDLWFFGLWMMGYSLLSVVVNLYLSINRTKVFIPLSIGAIIQAFGIWVFHNNFFEVILISFIITSLLLISLLLYYYKNLYEEKK